MTRKWIDFNARKTWAVLLALFGLVFALGGYGSYRVSEQRLRAEKHNELAVIAALKSGQIAEWRQARLDDVRMYAASPLFRRAVAAWLKDPGDTGLRDDFRERFRLVEEIYGYTGALLLDPDGRMLLNVRDDPEAVDAATVAAVAQAVAEKRPVLSELFRGDDGHICLDAAAPVLDADNQPVAAVVLRYDAQKYLYPHLQSWPVPSRSAETLLVRKDGDSVLFLNDLRFQAGAALTQRFPLTRTDIPAVQAVLGKQNEFEGNDYRNVAVLAHLELVTGSHWFMVAKVDRSEMLAELSFRAWVSALFVMVLIGLTAAVMAFLARQRQFRVYQALHASEQETREARQAQGVSELRYRRLFEAARDGILILDAETGMVVDVNPYMIEITGHSKEEFLQRKVWDLGFFRNIVANQDNFAELQQKEYVRYEDMPLESADGSQVDVEFVSNVYLVEGKKVIQCNIREISERKRAERALHAEKEFARTLLDNIVDGVVACDAKGTLVLFNRAAQEWHGMDALTIPSGEWGSHYDLYEPDGTTPQPTGAVPLLRAFHGETVRDVEMSIVAKGRPPRHILASGSPFYDDRHNILGAVAVMHDITERRRAESLLVERVAELQRWQNVTLGRENRVLELKHEVNELLGKAGQPPRYPSAESLDRKEK